MLNQGAIDRRLAAYMVCYANATWSRHQAIIFGNEHDRISHERRMITLSWAMSILCGYSPDGECKGTRTVTYDEVCCAMKIADPCCVTPGCVKINGLIGPDGDGGDGNGGNGGGGNGGGGNGGGGGTSCDPIVSVSVLNISTVSDRAAIEGASPNTNDAYLVVSGATDGVWSANTIQTWNGSTWVSAPVVTGQIIATTATPDPTYWITVPGQSTPGNLFPSLNITFQPGTSTYAVVSQYPAVSAYMNRTVNIEVTIGGVPVLIYIGAEATIATPINLNTGVVGATSMTLTYSSGACEWDGGTTATSPGACIFPRDHDCADHNTLDHS